MSALAAAASGSTTGWAIGYTIGIIVVLVVVALVVPILVLAHSIGNDAKDINDSLQLAVHNTAALTELQHDHRPRRGHRGRAEPRPHPAGRLTWHDALVVHADLDPARTCGGAPSSAASSSCSRSPRCSPSWCCWSARSTSGCVLVRDTLKEAAANTADTALIAETAKRVDAVLAEGLEHHLFLGRVLGKVRM